MYQKDKKAFGLLLAMMHEAFTPDKNLPNDRKSSRAVIYFQMLKDLPLKAVQEAVESLIKTRKAAYPPYPMIAEIREMALGGKEELDDEGLNAWNDIKRIYRRYIDSQNEGGPEFKLNELEKIIYEAVMVAFGSWDRCLRGMDSIHFDRQHFIKCYRLVKKRWILKKFPLLEEGEETKQLGSGEL